MSALPTQVLGKDQVTTDPVSPLTRAWGDPPIALRCGVPTPAALTADAQVFSVDQVDWFAEQIDGAVRFSTVNRAVTVEVVVPNSYSPQADALVDVGAAVRAHDRLLPGATAGSRAATSSDQ